MLTASLKKVVYLKLELMILVMLNAMTFPFP